MPMFYFSADIKFTIVEPH